MARPTLSYLRNLFLFLFGLPCALLSGLTGIGSSVVLLPLLGWLLGLKGSRAAGTALAATFFAALTALLSYGQNGHVRWGLAVWLTVGQTAGAVAGQLVLGKAPALARRGTLWAVLVVGLGLLMAADAARAVRIGAFAPAEGSGVYWGTALVLSPAVGMGSRILGLGGVLLVPALLYGLGLTAQTAQGTALATLALAALPALLSHSRRADLEPVSATWLSVSAVFGALVGAFWANHLTGGELRTIFAVTLTGIGVWMLWRGGGRAASQ